MTTVYSNFYDHFLTRYCRDWEACVLPCEKLIKTGIDQPKIYPNVNKRLADLYGNEKVKRFNNSYKNLVHYLECYPGAVNCVNNVLHRWLKLKNRKPRFNCCPQQVCKCECGPNRNIYHANSKCNWCNKCRVPKCSNGCPPDQHKPCGPCGKEHAPSKCNQYVSRCPKKPKCGGCTYKDKCLCKTELLDCHPRCEPPTKPEVHAGYCDPCRKTPTSNSIQKDLHDCLPCGLKEDCKVKYLIGDVVRYCL